MNIVIEEIITNYDLQIEENITEFIIKIEEMRIPAQGNGNSEISEYHNLFTYTTGAQIFTIPSSLKIMSVTLNDGRILKKNIDWNRTSTTEFTVIFSLENNDKIYITGLN